VTDEPGVGILVVEDDRSVARVMVAALRARGYDAAAVTTGSAALNRVEHSSPAVVLLDLGLPDVDGIDVCRRLRRWSTVPIIIITAEGSDDRKVLALDEGADDYITKPFSMPELMARVRVALRHRRAAGMVDSNVLEVGDVRIDLPRHMVSVAGQSVELTPKEFAFLALLARHAGKVLTHRNILAEVWGPTAIGETQYLRVYANQLRKKLGEDPKHPRLITEPGVGYRLVDRDETNDPR
jgi:two-component system KDP operon response regulator KdpE